MDTWIQIAEHLGIPFACLAALAAAIWVWGNRLAAFLAPLVRELVSSTATNAAGIQALNITSESNHKDLYAVVIEIKAKCDAILHALKAETTDP